MEGIFGLRVYKVRKEKKKNQKEEENTMLIYNS